MVAAKKVQLGFVMQLTPHRGFIHCCGQPVDIREARVIIERLHKSLDDQVGQPILGDSLVEVKVNQQGQQVDAREVVPSHIEEMTVFDAEDAAFLKQQIYWFPITGKAVSITPEGLMRWQDIETLEG